MARRRGATDPAPAASGPSSIREAIDDWIRWYRDEWLNNPPPEDLEWDPVKVGPTWEYDDGWVLPEKTLGWNVLGWCSYWLRDKAGNNWIFTQEQARFILWMYAVDDNGDFLCHSAVLQRLKGWGKDPIAACISLAECFAHVRFDHWDEDGNPVGREETSAWVQVVAVSQTQTKNTFKLFPGLVSTEARAHYGIQVGKLNVYGLNDTRHIEAVTSSVMAIEGGRPTLTIRAETQNWNSSNGGHDMAGAMEGNAAKSEGGAARILDICNAFRPGQDSVGERAREAYEQTQGDSPEFAEFGVLYDSLEAPPDAPLTAEDAPAVVRSIAGDSFWLDTRPRGRIVKSILNPQNPASESRRKWYNQITAVEESWVGPQDFDDCKAGEDVKPATAKDEVVLFLDASKSDDSTALIGCRISDGHVFVVKIWQRPTRLGKKVWQVNRDDVDHEVTVCFNTYRVVGFWVDPSDARDDETGARFWENHCDAWATRYGRRLRLKAVRTGESKHAVIWDMRSRVHTKQFTEQAERTVTDIEERALTHDGSPLLVQHVRNSRRSPNEFGVSLTKEHRESLKKIDGAVAMVGARLMRRFYQVQLEQKQQSGKKAAMNQQKVVVMGGRERRARHPVRPPSR